MANTHIVGIHAVLSLIQNQPERVLRLCIQKERHDKKIDEIMMLAKEMNIKIDLLPKKEFERLAHQDMHHQGVLAVSKQLSVFGESDIERLLPKDQPVFILILDGVQDPHNLGACFRSADAAGVDMIIAPKDKSVSVTPVVSKVASGAAEVVPFVQVTNLVRTIEWLKEKGVWVYGAAGEATQNLYQTDFTGSMAIVLGAEGSGLRRLTREHCDALVKIPMEGSVASLNVSVATGIFLFEVIRQRSFRAKSSQ